ncbi:MAG: 4-aminobutyrate--2-oxoglutarate transaminase [Firmicutes bacterium]|nr:4-aminobutyrate--2-oxoglutarate transaminase [Alicyclobacillaceae bacterium]MCL6498277.1 4-aminobutyrate--2-oxoglutarate transaminase [Bacillota bacterium]
MPERRFVHLVTAIPGPTSSEWLQTMARVVPRALAVAHPVVVATAHGTRLTDVDGNTFLDLTGGIGALNVGHTDDHVTAAIRDQAGRFLHTDFSVVPYAAYVTLAERLAARFPGGEAAKVMFFNSGAEAVENAVKIARRATGRSAIVTFERAFHGRTYMALSLTGRTTPYKTGMGPWAPEVYRIPYPYPFRCPWAAERPHRCGPRCYQHIAEALSMQVDPRSVAAVIVEPVQGEGGFIVPPEDFLPWLSAFCRQHGILLIDDEVQAGYGRTGRFFACEHGGVRPDLICVAKSIAGGLPLSAVIGRAAVMDVPEPGALGGTFIGNPVAVRAALAVLDRLERDGLLEAATAQGARVRSRLERLAQRHPEIGDVRGLGAMVGMELVDPTAPDLPPNPKAADRVVVEARNRGVLLLKAGAHGHVIRFLAPLTTTPEEWEEALDILDEAVEAALSRTAATGYHERQDGVAP